MKSKLLLCPTGPRKSYLTTSCTFANHGSVFPQPPMSSSFHFWKLSSSFWPWGFLLFALPEICLSSSSHAWFILIFKFLSKCHPPPRSFWPACLKWLHTTHKHSHAHSPYAESNCLSHHRILSSLKHGAALIPLLSIQVEAQKQGPHCSSVYLRA